MKKTDQFAAILTTIVVAGWLLPRFNLTEASPSRGQPKRPGEPIKKSPHAGQKDAVSGDPAEMQAGAGAESPSEIPPKGWWHVLKRAVAGFSEDRVMTEAAGVTFYALLALFPAVASFISIYGLFSDPTHLTDQLQSLGGIVPGGGIDIIKDQVTSLTSNGNKALGLGAIFGLATSLWSANAGMKSLFTALNVVYHEHEKRGFVRFTLTAFAFTLGAIAFVIVALLAVVAVPLILNSIGLSSISETLLSVLRWPFMLLVLTAALALIYRYGPSRNKARWQWVSWGGGVAAVLWLVASLLEQDHVEVEHRKFETTAYVSASYTTMILMRT